MLRMRNQEACIVFKAREVAAPMPQFLHFSTGNK